MDKTKVSVPPNTPEDPLTRWRSELTGKDILAEAEAFVRLPISTDEKLEVLASTQKHTKLFKQAVKLNELYKQEQEKIMRLNGLKQNTWV